MKFVRLLNKKNSKGFDNLNINVIVWQNTYHYSHLPHGH